MEYEGFKIVSDNDSMMKRIATIGSGTLPAFLKGRFTDNSFAKKQIDVYISQKEKVKDAKTAKSTSRGKQS